MQGHDDETIVEPRALSGAQWRDLEECTGRLEQALQSAVSALDLNQFLPPPGSPHRLAVLHELIKTELEARYLRGDRCLLEEYLARYPELGNRDDLPASLLYEEFHVRQRFGSRPALEEYRDRFPEQYRRLRRLLPPGADTETDPVVLQELVGYQKLELLGQGKFGEVWKALAPGGVEVAIKFILRKIDRELKALEEIRRLRHSHLLQTHSYGMMEGKLTIVMELADMSLSERYKQCRDQGMAEIPKDWLVNYFKQAAAALDYLRQQRVSHCDIKPENLLIQQGLAKVADFGLAHAQDERLDLVSTVVGTPYYMAPEMWKQQVSSHSDQYSLAATYVHLRLGNPLFQGSFFEVMEQHVASEPKLDPLPAAEQAVLRIALAKDPEHRFPSCAAFAQALADAVEPPAPVPAPPPPSPVAHLGLILAVATLLFVSIGIFVFNRSAPAERPDWQPEGWLPENSQDLVKDLNGRRYYRRLAREVAGHRVILVAVPRLSSVDPPTFYMMENKVWNDLYAAFYAKSRPLFEKQASCSGCERLLSFEPFWTLGAWADRFNPDPEIRPFLGVDGDQRLVPVFRVTPTEAYCFAEWLGGRHGRLPSRLQWRRAAGKNEDKREGPYSGSATVTDGLPVNLEMDGPWPVNRGDRDISIFGCRQMAGNGLEWTRDLQGETATIPLEALGAVPARGYLMSQSYRSRLPLTFADMDQPRLIDCTKRNVEITFRIVLEE